MNELFALDATELARDRSKWCKALGDRFGFGTGLFVADLEGDFVSRVRAIADAQGVDAMEVKRLKELANKARKEWLLPTEGAHGSDWLEVALKSRDAGLVEAIIATDHAHRCYSVEDVLWGDACELLKPRSSALIDTTSEDYAKAFKPLIMKSTEMHLLDRYAFTLSFDKVIERWAEFFDRVQRLSTSAKRENPSFVLHLWPQGISNFPGEGHLDAKIQQINKKLASSASMPLTVKYVLRNDSAPHDRFLWTVKGAMNLGRGIFLPTDPEQTYVGYLDAETSKQVYYQYVEAGLKQLSKGP